MSSFFICGAGRFGRYIAEQLVDNNIEITAFVDNGVVGDVLGIKVIKPAELVDPENSIFIVAVLSAKERQELILDLITVGCKKVYIATNSVFTGKLSVVDDIGEIKKIYLSYYRDTKPVLPYVEFHLSDMCNLKCARCGHCANIAQNHNFPDIDVFKSNLIRLRELFANIERFRLMGGEPFLNCDYPVFVETIKDVFPKSNVFLVSNGLLLKEQREKLGRIKDKIVVQISQYPPTREIIDEIVEWGIRYGIELEISRPIKAFFSSLSTGRSDAQKSFSVCVSKDCHFMRDHYILPCPFIWVAKEYGSYLGIEVDKDSFDTVAVDLNKAFDSDGWEILKRFHSFNVFCEYCADQYKWHEWEISKENRPDEWYAN